MNSSNIVIKTITNMGIYGLQSVMEANRRLLQSKCYMEEMNMFEMWKQQINSESNEVRMSVQIRVLCEWRDKCDCTFLKRMSAKLLLMIYVQIKFIYMSVSVFNVSYFMVNKEFQTNKLNALQDELD